LSDSDHKQYLYYKIYKRGSSLEGKSRNINLKTFIGGDEP